MSGTREDILRAEAEAAAAKLRMHETLERLKNRLNPAVRLRETLGDVRERGEVLADDAVELAYDRPQMIAGVVLAIALFVLKRPIARLFHRVSRPARSKWDYQDSPAAGPAGRRLVGQKGDR